MSAASRSRSDRRSLGLDSFTGRWHHTAQWPQDGVDFSGRRVAVVGTGSTGIQAIPLIARQAEQLYVFQRTANYSMPAHNRPLDPEFVAQVRSGWPERRRIAQESDAGMSVPRPDRGHVRGDRAGAGTDV